MSSSTTLRHELLVGFAVLFAGALLLGVVGLLLLLPSFDSPVEGIVYVGVLLLADLGILAFFGGHLLRSRLVEPVDSLVEDVRSIAGGAYHHRVGPLPGAELEAIQASVNAMADRLVKDQERLAENVESLERTNRELVEARDQIIHSARLASVGTLAAGIAHEIGNPLGAVLGYVDVARGRVTDAGGDPAILNSIREEARRIDRIVRSLLDYARPKQTELRPTPPAQVVVRVRELLESQGRLDQVEDRWVLDSRGVPEVLMEPHRLEQVLVNLLLNALDALEEVDEKRLVVVLDWEPGGVTRLPPRRESDPPAVNYMHRRRVAGDEGGRNIDPLFTAEKVAVVRVEDSGPGITPDDLDRIFDPFFTTKEPGQGTGLGLSICARLVEGMGGRIEAENLEGGGAGFTVRLPGIGPDGVLAVEEGGSVEDVVSTFEGGQP